jgi:secreted trypsin-like serine protease
MSCHMSIHSFLISSCSLYQSKEPVNTGVDYIPVLIEKISYISLSGSWVGFAVLTVIRMIIFTLLVMSVISACVYSQEEKEEVGRIVNGQEADKGELPYQVSIQLNFGSRLVSSKSLHFCGGALIAKNWVLTAAHCVRRQSARKLKVVAGTNDITDKTSPIYRVKKIIMHKYNDITKLHDVALLQIQTKSHLERQSKKGHQIIPVSLCKESFQPQGRNCTVSGWGHLKSKGSTVPDKLREVSVRVLHDSVCQKMLKGFPWDPNTESMLCAGGEDKDACQGDSGGPMVCQDDNGEICIAGVVSWGMGCATEGIPGVYTNVRKYNQWIQDHMSGM